jgi:hypothetical protein
MFTTLTTFTTLKMALEGAKLNAHSTKRRRSEVPHAN